MGVLTGEVEKKGRGEVPEMLPEMIYSKVLLNSPNGAQLHQCELLVSVPGGGVTSEQFWSSTFFTTDMGFRDKWYEQ